MTRRTGLLLLAGVVVAVALLFAVMFSSRQRSEELPTEGEKLPAIASRPEGSPVYLLFPGTGGKLHEEERQLPPSETPESTIRQLIEALLEGPQSEALHPLFQIAVTSVDVLLTHNSLLYVDLMSTGHSTPPSMGSHREILTVFALVNSIMLNFPEIRGIVLLWNGEQNVTFAGHIDTSHPLAADFSLAANPPE